MKRFDTAMRTGFDQRLAAREREICELLAAREAPSQPAAGPDHEVVDFKDVALSEAEAFLNAAQAEQAAIELEQVLAARRRLEDHSFGTCLDCGEPIELARLEALPWVAHCTACQAERERHDGSPPTRH